MMVEERLELGRLVTFIPNKRIPIHNWFYYKEAFSRDFVALVSRQLGLGEGSWVLDPFCGVGTTQLTGKELGINTVGVDVAELPVFASQVKTANYDVEQLKRISEKVFSEKFRRLSLGGLSRLVRRAFPKHVLEDVLFFREIVENIEDETARGFFKLGLISAAMKASYVVKNGGLLRIVKERNVPPFRKFYRNRIKRMIKDVEAFKMLNPKVTTFKADSRNLRFLEDEMFDAVITSPPYLNKIEYTKVYSVENELFFKGSEPMLRSYIGDSVRRTEDSENTGNMPAIVKAYFQDLRRVLSELHRVLKKNGAGVFVIAQGVFPTGVVETEKIFVEIAEETGFETERLWLVNRRVATRDRVVKIGYADEYVVFTRKP
ncbi:MAG: site-specific DNA-methyltransferase [Crenarchaeota archaeon]|nr:site-specific DNA-methyltransferase [Thermoproteota archaeon]